MQLLQKKQQGWTRSKQKRAGSSVQSGFVRIREVEHNILFLGAPEDPANHEYRAVLEVTSTNFTLKAEDEQEVIIDGYRAFLKSLSFPIQVLVRSQRLDLSQYLQNLEESTDSDDEATWQELASSHAQFIRELASKRTLLEHRFYIIIPSEQIGAFRSNLLTSHLPWVRKRRRQQAREETLAKAQQQLDLRANGVMQQLASVGLHCRRLEGLELISLYYSCITPDRAIHYPLTSEMIAAGHVTRVVQRKKGASTPAYLEEWQSLHRRNDTSQLCMPSHNGKKNGTSGRALALPDLPHLADLVSPASVEITRDSICLEDEYACGIAVTSFPREVRAGWLAPLLLHDEIVEIVFHLHPQDNTIMLHQLMRRKNQYRASRQTNVRRGRLEDPELNVAEKDVDGLIAQLASGEERIFDVGFYLIIRASDQRSLNARRDRVMAILRNLFLVARPTTFEHAQVFRSFLPEARDELMRTFTLDSASLSTAFPFISNSLFMSTGVLAGITPAGEPVIIDEWDESLDNPHEFTGAITGAGKSYFVKVRIMRELLQHRKQGLQDVVIDPDGEYKTLCQALGAEYLRLAPGSEQHLNPLDLLPPGTDIAEYVADHSRGDRFADKVQALHAFFDIMLSDRSPTGMTPLTAREKGLLDRAIYEMYNQKGITADPRTHDREVPLLRDLYEVLKSGVCGKDEFGLTERLYRYVFGSLAGPFNAPTDVQLNSHLVVFDVRDMAGEELRPLGIWLITDFVWTQVLTSYRPRKLYIDEAWSLIQHPEGGRFLANLARRARKRYLALCTITQNPELFAEDTWGAVVAANAATKVLKRQDRTSVEAVTKRFQLTAGERQHLLTFAKHEALLIAGGKRVIIHIEASPFEHALATTDPRELASRSPQQFLTRQPRHIVAPIGNRHEEGFKDYSLLRDAEE